MHTDLSEDTQWCRQPVPQKRRHTLHAVRFQKTWIIFVVTNVKTSSGTRYCCYDNMLLCIWLCTLNIFGGRDSAVGIATRYGLDGPCFERFSLLVENGSEANPAFCTIDTVSLFPAVKRPVHVVNHPPTSAAHLKQRAEIYLYSPSGPSWPVVGRTLPFYLTLCSSHTVRSYVWGETNGNLYCKPGLSNPRADEVTCHSW